MKATKELDGIRALSVSDLRTKLDDARRKLFGLKFNAATVHLKDYSQCEKLRKNIARFLTVLKEKEVQ